MSSQSSHNCFGVGFCGLLAIAFIVLKLTDIIAWPWLWVLSPLWIPAAFILAVVVLWLVFVAIYNKGF